MWRILVAVALTACLVESSRDEEDVKEAVASAKHRRLDLHSHNVQSRLSTGVLVADRPVLKGFAAKAGERFRSEKKRVKQHAPTFGSPVARAGWNSHTNSSGTLLGDTPRRASKTLQARQTSLSAREDRHCEKQWARYELGMKKNITKLLEGMQKIRKSWALVEQAQMMGFTKPFAGTQRHRGVRTDEAAETQMSYGMKTAKELLQRMDALGVEYHDRMKTMLSAEQREKFDARCAQGNDTI